MMSGMDVDEFLLARLDEDEKIARAIDNKQLDSGWSASYNQFGLAETPPGWYITPHIGLAYEEEGARHIARFNPERVLREIAAKRRLVEKFRVNDGGWGHELDSNGWHSLPNPRAGANYAMWDALVTLAGTYSDHSDFDPAWAE